MDERPEQRPEGALIAAALKRSRMSQRQAAAKAGISENRFRAIVHGYQTVSAGTHAPVRGPAETLARIAQVVGVTPEQLEEADRGDAAQELRALLPPAGVNDDERIRLIEQKFRESEQAAAEGRALLEQLRRERRQGA
jgi:hypothetical protein